MHIRKVLVSAIVICSFFVIAPSASAAEQAVHEGKIVKVVPAEREIYIYADGEKYEYYFNDQTAIRRADKDVPFAELKEGQRVRVAANKIGKRLDPISVDILE